MINSGGTTKSEIERYGLIRITNLPLFKHAANNNSHLNTLLLRAKMNPSFLFISIDGMTDPLGQSQVIPYLAGLAKKGYAITIISCEKEENFATNQKTIARLLEEADINWKYCFYSRKIPLLSQRGNLQKLKKLAAEYVKNSKGTFITHCRSYLPALVGLHLKKKYGARLIFDMRGFWADERIEGGIWKLKNPLHKSAFYYFKRKEKELIAGADYIVTLTKKAKETVISRSTGKIIEVIPCCADLDHFKIKSPAEKASARKNLGIDPGTFVLGYLGSLGTWYMLDEMLDLFAEVLKQKPDSKLFFVTQDDKLAILAAAKKKNIPVRSLLIKPASRIEVPGFISTFDAGLFFIRPTFSKTGSSPTKMAELLACGIPVIMNTRIGDCDEIIQTTDCGVLISDFTKNELKKAVSSILTLNTKDPEALRRIAENHFSLEKGIASYEKIYDHLLGGQ